jgi:hypothetical protein
MEQHPLDIWVHIGGFLTPHDLRHSRLVSQSFRLMLDHNHHAWSLTLPTIQRAMSSPYIQEHQKTHQRPFAFETMKSIAYALLFQETMSIINFAADLASNHQCDAVQTWTTKFPVFVRSKWDCTGYNISPLFLP